MAAKSATVPVMTHVEDDTKQAEEDPNTVEMSRGAAAGTAAGVALGAAAAGLVTGGAGIPAGAAAGALAGSVIGSIIGSENKEAGDVDVVKDPRQVSPSRQEEEQDLPHVQEVRENNHVQAGDDGMRAGQYS
eukprot:jgi/Chrzof1/2455/Cz11g16120.t1